jgi:hypothetical protein
MDAVKQRIGGYDQLVVGFDIQHGGVVANGQAEVIPFGQAGLEPLDEFVFHDALDGQRETLRE